MLSHLKNMLSRSIRSRIFAGFGVLILLLVWLAVKSHLGFSENADSFRQHGAINRQVEDVVELERNLLELQRAVLAYTHSGYRGLIQKVRQQNELIGRQIKVIGQEFPDEQRASILKRMTDYYLLYARNFEEAVQDRSLRDRLLHEELVPEQQGMILLLSKTMQASTSRKQYEAAALTGVALEDLLRAHQGLLMFLATPDGDYEQEARSRYRQFELSIQRLQTLYAERDIKQSLRVVAETMPHYASNMNQVIQSTRAYLAMTYVVMAGESLEISYLSKELKDLSLLRQRRLEQTIEENQLATQRFNILVSVLIVLISLFMASKIVQSISDPIRRMTRTFTSLAAGQMELEIPGQGRCDEIGDMAAAANVFKGRALELIEARAAAQTANENAEKSYLLAITDALTHLPNRRAIVDDLAKIITSNIRHHEYAAVLMMDLDGFKYINDSYGHETGDVLLVQLATRLGQGLRETDRVGRLGGDEFVVLLSRLGSNEQTARKDALEIAQRLINNINQPFTYENLILRVGVSIGIRVLGDEPIEVQTALREADTALYDAKGHGRNRAVFFKRKE